MVNGRSASGLKGFGVTTNLTVIVPTLGRTTLAATLNSIRAQSVDSDEILVVADTDGDVDRAYAIFNAVSGEDSAATKWRFLQCASDQYGRGYAQREYAIERAKGTHLCFQDDDDTFSHNGLSLMRDAATDIPVLFRFKHKHGVIWQTPKLRFGDIGTPCIVTPNSNLGRWEPTSGGTSGGDFTFIDKTVRNHNGCHWREEIVSLVRPHL